MRTFENFAILFYVLVLAVIVSGCTPQPLKSTPVPVACVKKEQIPVEPDRVAPQLNGNAGHDLPIVSVSALDLRKWGGELRALLTGCM